MPAEDVARIKRNAAEVKDDFMIPECDHPGAKVRLNHSWSRSDFVAMAQKTGDLGKLIISGYYMPLRHAHTNFAGMIERLEMVGDTIAPIVESDPKLMDRSLVTAHVCLVDAIRLQEERFKIEGLPEACKSVGKTSIVCGCPVRVLPNCARWRR